MTKRDRELYERIKHGDHEAVEEVYVLFKGEFSRMTRKMGLASSEIEDLYQETILAFYENIVLGKINDAPRNLRAYILGIGKFKIIDFLNERRKFKIQETDFNKIELIQYESISLSEEQQLLKENVNKLGVSCQEILKLYYLRGLTIKEIVKIGEYKNENTVKSHKSRCLKRLKELIRN